MGGKKYVSGNLAPAGILRWLPPLVVFGVVWGFVALSWYAYRTGTSTRDGDLPVVEADKTPVKEKPLDSGGMQFPNQDKTIFDTFSADSRQPPKVERVLPVPEEPVAQSVDASAAAGWVNDKKSSNIIKPEQMIAPANDIAKKEQDVMEAVKKPMAFDASQKPLQVAEMKSQPDEQTTMYVAQPEKTTVAMPEENQKKTTPSVTATPIVNVPAKSLLPEKPIDKPSTAATEQMDAIVGFREKSSGTVKVQLGAYRSEKEAQGAWSIIQKKHHDLLAKSSRNIMRADLGAKGIYYRLQVGGLADPADAKALCGKLVAAGQVCLVVPGTK